MHPERAREWTPQRVMAYGLPTMGDADEAVALREDQRASGWKGGPAHVRPCRQRCRGPPLGLARRLRRPHPSHQRTLPQQLGCLCGGATGAPRLPPDDSAPPTYRWATVELPWDEGPLLLTLGCAWLSSPLAAALPVQCAVLHRVVAPPRDRHSIPFLVDLKPAEPEP